MAFASGIFKVGGPEILNFVMTKLNDNLRSKHLDKEVEMYLDNLGLMFHLMFSECSGETERYL